LNLTVNFFWWGAAWYSEHLDTGHSKLYWLYYQGVEHSISTVQIYMASDLETGEDGEHAILRHELFLLPVFLFESAEFVHIADFPPTPTPRAFTRMPSISLFLRCTLG
jgi:hypothetical protein